MDTLVSIMTVVVVEMTELLIVPIVWMQSHPKRPLYLEIISDFHEDFP